MAYKMQGKFEKIFLAKKKYTLCAVKYGNLIEKTKFLKKKKWNLMH